MTKLNPQFIVNQAGERVSVVLPIAEYLRLLEEVEEQDNIKQYLSSKQAPQTFIDAEEAFASIEKKRLGK